jgi:perosamine synthetase
MIHTSEFPLGLSAFTPQSDAHGSLPPLLVAGVTGLFEDRRRRPSRERSDTQLVLEERIPNGRHDIDEDDLLAVLSALRGKGLARGSTVGAFEMAFAAFTGAKHAVALSNGTAALHLALEAAGIGPGDAVIVPALAATACATAVRYVGATVVFADVCANTLTIDPSHVASLITPRTRAILAVDHAGLPADLSALSALAARYGLVLIEDGGSAPSAEFDGRRVGSIADCTTFSLLPGQRLSIGEAGMLTTNDAAIAERVRELRNFGLRAASHHSVARREDDMVALGYNYHLSDVHAAVGLSQLRRITEWTAHCRALAERYTAAFAGISAIVTQTMPADRTHAYQQFPIRVDAADPARTRESLCQGLRARGIDASPPSRPIYLHSYWRALGYANGLCPVAERLSEGLLSLPLWHGLSFDLQERVIDAVLAEVAVHA